MTRTILIASCRFLTAALLAAICFTSPVLGQNQLRPRTAYLGVGIVDVDLDRVNRLKLSEERGVEVTAIEEGGAADVAGIKPGDVILTFNGEKILGAQQFVRLMHETPAGRKVRVSIWRDAKEQALTVTTGASPSLRAMEHAANLVNRLQDMQELNDRVSSLSGMPPMPPLTSGTDVPMVIMAWSNAMLGIECEPVEAQLAQYFGAKEGVLVRSVGKGTAADKAGIKVGDVLTAISNRGVKTPDDLRRSLRSAARQMNVSLIRDHKEVSVTVLLNADRDQ